MVNKILFFGRGLGIKYEKKSGSAPYQMGVIKIGQPIGFMNYLVTYSQDIPVVTKQSINIKAGQPIGFMNYGFTYAQDVT